MPICFAARDRQKKLSEVVYKKDVFKNFAKFTGNHLCWNLLFDKIAGSA